MNEITQIHLGRTAFTIAVDAQKMLRDYLAAVKKHMGGNGDAVEEVEMRMAELLTERGITGNKVVLAKDVEYLKEQLGEPKDFDDEDVSDSGGTTDDTSSRRLFRDTENGMVAGVAAGLANYFQVDAVILRILFIVATVAGGWGILIYLILWVVVPEAKTPSDTLKMRGRAVTVDTIKEVVERADVQGAASRVQRLIGSMINGVARVVGALVGLGLVAAGIIGLFGAIMTGVYWALNHDLVPPNIFPVGASEIALICLGFVAVLAATSFFLISGMAVMRRKWPLPSWGLGAIVAVFLASLAIGGALTADAVPKIQERYEATHHSYTRTVPAFSSLRVVGDSYAQVRYEESPTYSVTAEYWGNAPFAGLKTTIDGQTLTVDTNDLVGSMKCAKLCLWHDQTVYVTVHGPKLQAVATDLDNGQLTLSKLHDQTLTVRLQNGAVEVSSFSADTVQAKLGKDGVWTLGFTGDYEGSPSYQQKIELYDQSARITARNLDLSFDGSCGVAYEASTGPWMGVGTFESIKINGELIGGPADLRAAYDKPGRSPAKCVTIGDYITDSL